MNEDLRETLVILGEECNEVAKEIFKILRYGPDQIKPGTEKTNIQHLEQEIGDLEAMIELIKDLNVGVSAQGTSQAKLKKFTKLKILSTLKINK